MKKIYKVGWSKITPRGGLLIIVKENEDRSVDLTCSICSEDKELFPQPFNIKAPSDLKTRCPCACAKVYRWSEYQRAIQIERECEKRGYVFKGFKDTFRGNKTYIKLYNPSTGNLWDGCNIANFLNNKRGDPVEGRKTLVESRALSVEDRIKQVEEILKREGIPQKIEIRLECERRSFSKFIWVCKRGHETISTFNNFINHNTRCKECHHITNIFTGFVEGIYETKRYEDDYIYILRIKNSEESFYKIGRSFCPERRAIDIRSSLPKSYMVDILYLEKHKHEDCVKREKELLGSTLDKYYLPQTKFAGHTEARELFNIEDVTMT